jgi:hypothetical protein
MPVSISGTNGVTFPDSSLQAAAASPYVLKNRIINGDMRIWQRGTSISVGSASYTYTADRFKNYSANTSTTVSRNTSVPTGFQYSFQLQRPNANTGTNSLSINQIIETANCYDLAGQSVTFSFWVKKGANYSGGNITVQILTGTVADQGGDPYSWTGLATAVNDTTYTPTTTWTRVTYTGTVASNALEVCPVIAFTPTGTAGADDSLYITGVQLEIGTSATPFERRLYNQELANCQRYYYKLQSNSADSFFGSAFNVSTTLAIGITFFPVTLRTAPSALEQSGTAGDYRVRAAAGNTNCSAVPTWDGSSVNNGTTIFTVASGLTSGQGVALRAVNSSAYLAWSAEL